MPTPQFNHRAFGFQKQNAYILARMSQIAYEKDQTKARNAIQELGIKADHVIFFDQRDTQAILVADHDKIIVAFRGSEPVLGDWMTNAKVRKTSTACGDVHRGFYAALNTIWLDMEDAIEDIRNDYLYQLKDNQTRIPPTLWFTGHSLGGALATLATALCKFKEDAILVNGLYTYGQPRVGSEKFANFFNTALKDRSFRVVNNNDIVTRVPLSMFNYSHVGQLRYFDHQGDLRNDTDLSWWNSFWDSVEGQIESFKSMHPDSIVDHDLGRYYVPYCAKALNVGSP